MKTWLQTHPEGPVYWSIKKCLVTCCVTCQNWQSDHPCIWAAGKLGPQKEKKIPAWVTYPGVSKSRKELFECQNLCQGCCAVWHCLRWLEARRDSSSPCSGFLRVLTWQVTGERSARWDHRWALRPAEFQYIQTWRVCKTTEGLGRREVSCQDALDTVPLDFSLVLLAGGAETCP